MPDLKHPETGQHTRASAKTVERLLEEGWELIERIVTADEADAEAVSPAPDDDGAQNKGQDGDTPPEPAAFDPNAKLADMAAFAIEHGLFDEAKIESWRKPGTKKVDVAAEITAALDAKTAEGQ